MFMRNDRNSLVNFKPGEYMRKMFFFQSVSDTDGSEEKIRILPLGAKPLTFWLLLQALYHKATGDSWKLSPFFPPFLSLSLYQLRQ